MQQTLKRTKLMAVDNCSPYFTLKPRQNHVIRANNQVLQVISGLAWVSNNGEDIIVKAGEAITLMKGSDAVVTVSGLFKKSVKYILHSS